MTRPAPDEDPLPPAGPAASDDGTAELPGPGPAAGTAPEPDPAAPARSPAARTRRAAWREWRGRRPFAGGLLVALAGGEILLTEKAPLPVVVHIGMEGLAGYLVPTVMVVCGLLIVFNPAQRLFYSILSVLLSLGSWITSNLGGFVFGLLLGIVGSTLAFGWLPDQEPRRGLLRRLRERGPAAPAAGPEA